MATARSFPEIDNYIYLHHTDTLLILPVWPTNIADTSSVSYAQTDIMTRTAPIYSYSRSGPRAITFTFDVHREMMQQVNWGRSSAFLFPGDDYIDAFVKQIQAACLPVYAASQKMVDPPLVSVRVGNDVFIKGVVTGSVGVDYRLPVLKNNKYAQCGISFTVSEVDPYDAYMVMQVGSYRNGGDILLNTSMDRNVYTSSPNNSRGYVSGGNSTASAPAIGRSFDMVR